MKTYLLAWKPARSEWEDLPEMSIAVKEGKGELYVGVVENRNVYKKAIERS
jgi:hypothetical protein